MAQVKSQRFFQWVVDFGPMIGRKIKVETREGFRRTGILTEVKFLDLTILGVEVSLPREIVLDGDFPIPFEQIRDVPEFAE